MSAASPSAPLAEPDPFVGRTLGGAYRIVARLGQGSSGVVYRARHTLLDQDFAVKVLAPELAQDPEVRRRLLLEARSLTLFTHKHAVQVRHCGEDGGVLYLAMDLCRKETLAALLAREGALAEARAVGIVRQVLDALGEAHRAGIVHRDLKPANVMVETTTDARGAPEDRVRVLDFGLARIVGAEGRALPNALASVGGTVVGTVAYMSPEQLRADDEVDGRSDLFSVGAMLHEMLGGGLPFRAASTLSIAMRILEREPEPLPEAGPRGVSAAVRAVVGRALEKDPARRFPTAEAFSEALADALGGIAPPPLPRPAAAAAPVPSRRRGPRAALVAVAVAALAAAAFVGLPALESARTRSRRADANRALEEGRFEAAVDGFTGLVTAGDATPEDFLGRARARVALRDANAVADLDEATRLLPRDPRVPTERGRWLRLGPGRLDDARDAFARALALDETFAPARLERARLSLAQGRVDEAARDAAAYARSGGADAATARLLETEVALARAAAGGEDAEAARVDALRLAREATGTDPELADAHAAVARAHMALGLAARERGDRDAEQEGYARALEAQGEAIARAVRSPGHRGQGRRLADLHVTRASMHLSAHREPDALEDYQAAARLGPRDPETLHRVAYGLLQSGRLEEAIAAFERLTDLVGTTEQWSFLAFAHQRLALERERRGDREGALASLSTAVEVYGRTAALAEPGQDTVFPRSYRAEALVQRARLLEGEARAAALEEARLDFEEVERIEGPRFAADRDVRHRRAEWHHLRGDLEAALEDARAAAGEKGDGTPAMQGRAARYAIDLARAEAEARKPGRAAALLDDAVAFADRGARAAPGYASVYLRIRGEAKAARAALRATRAERRAAMEAAYEDFRAAHAAAQDDASARADALHAHAEALLAAEEPAEAAAKAREAARLRDAEAEAGRATPSAPWWRLAADAFERSRAAEDAEAARARADEIDAGSR